MQSLYDMINTFFVYDRTAIKDNKIDMYKNGNIIEENTKDCELDDGDAIMIVTYIMLIEIFCDEYF